MMSELKATPGPWAVMNGCQDIFGPLGGDSGDGWEADDTDGWHIAEVLDHGAICQGHQTKLGEECRKANALLIAAAPELYAALDTLFQLHCSTRLDGSGEYLKEFQAAHDALAKARGE